MAYRDTFDTCPRCGVHLVDARSARGCPQCRGLWIDEAVLSEMVLEMVAPEPGRLELAALERGGDPIACPTCKQPMHAATIHGVPLDRCAKHGVWFDGGKLEAVLKRVGEASRRPAPAPAPPAAGPAVRKRFELHLAVKTPGQPVREHAIAKDVVKIGRARISDVRVDDQRVSPFHAVIETTPRGIVTIIDLGSRLGTLVNGRRVNKLRLESGDQIKIGEMTIEVTF